MARNLFSARRPEFNRLPARVRHISRDEINDGLRARGLLAGRLQDHRGTQLGEPQATEISVNLPREMEMLEAQIRDVINRHVARGRLTVRVSLHAGAGNRRRGCT